MQFTETQKFRQWWLWLLLPGVLACVMVGPLVSYLGDSNISAGDVIAALASGIVPLGVLFLFIYLKLDTNMDEAGVNARFSIFSRRGKYFAWADVEQAYIRKYKPIAEYGGWGLRSGSRKTGDAYNVSGDMGLQLILKNGNRFLIGTQKADELQMLLDDLYKKGIVKPVASASNISDRY